MSDRQAQFRKAQQKRRERLKDAGYKPLTVELSAEAHACLKALSITLFDSLSQPSKVIEYMLVSAKIESPDIPATQETPLAKSHTRAKPRARSTVATKAKRMTLSTECTTLTRYQEGYGIVPKLLRADAKGDGWLSKISHQNRRLYEWSRWPEITEIDPDRWLKARSNKARAAMAQDALQRMDHSDATILFESIRSGKKYPPMPDEFMGWLPLGQIASISS
jgi:hypothetical protein